MTTQNCAECGTRAEPGQSFCDACGAVLRWDPSSTRPAATVPAAAAPAPEASAPAPEAPAPDGSGSPRPATPAPDGPGRPGGSGTPGRATPAPQPQPEAGGGGAARPDADGGRTAVAAGTTPGLMDSARAARAARAARTAGLAGRTTPPAPAGGAPSRPGGAAGPASGGPAPEPARHGGGPGAADFPRQDDRGPDGGQAHRGAGPDGYQARHGGGPDGYQARHGAAGGTHTAPDTRWGDDATRRDGGPGHDGDARRPDDDHRWGSDPRPTGHGHDPRPTGDGHDPRPGDGHGHDPRPDNGHGHAPRPDDGHGTRSGDGIHRGGTTATPSGADDDTAPLPGAPASAAPGDSMSDRARSLLVPVADPAAQSPAPPPAAAPVLPGRPDADRPAVRAPGQVAGVLNGAPCAWCSTPNRPDRHYCARCAMPLDETPDTAPLRAPWWRRIFGGRRHETPWAGDRPRLRRVFDRIGTWITLVVVITLVILGFVYIPDGIQASRDHFAKRAPVAPDGVTASRSYSGHKPTLAFDKRSNTWWGPGVSQSGRGEWIEVTFTEPTRLLDVIITPGVSTRADKIGESALPHRVTATITGKDGTTTTTRKLTLDQGAGAQKRPFRVGEVTKVRFTVESSHAASAEKQVAIAEIEFFGPSSANRT